MRLSSVVITTSDLSEEITFAVQDQDPNYRYLIRGMVGIDAEDIVPKFYGNGAVTGKKFFEFTMKPRNIVMRVSLNPVFRINEDVSEIRDAVARLISSNRTGELTLQFKDGASIVSAIKGKVIKFEVAHFTRTPELQITIKCDDPMFRSILPIDIPPAELPSANPVKLTDEPSTAPHGLSFKVVFTATTSTFVIQDDPTTPDWKFEVTPATSFLSGDELHFSSEYGAKRVFWDKASGTDIELMDKVTPDSVWPQIFPGLNELYFMQIANFDWLELKYYSTHWGL
jgi:hypothetical protein